MKINRPVAGTEEASDTVAIGDAITFVDSDYVSWRVTEHDGRDVPGAHGPRFLLFFSPGAIRRVWDYPASWRALDARALMSVSWHR